MAIDLVVQGVMAFGVPGSGHGVDVRREPGGLELDGCFEALVVIFASVENKKMIGPVGMPYSSGSVVIVGCAMAVCRCCCRLLDQFVSMSCCVR